MARRKRFCSSGSAKTPLMRIPSSGLCSPGRKRRATYPTRSSSFTNVLDTKSTNLAARSAGVSSLFASGFPSDLPSAFATDFTSASPAGVGAGGGACNAASGVLPARQVQFEIADVNDPRPVYGYDVHLRLRQRRLQRSILLLRLLWQCRRSARANRRQHEGQQEDYLHEQTSTQTDWMTRHHDWAARHDVKRTIGEMCRKRYWYYTPRSVAFIAPWNN